MPMEIVIRIVVRISHVSLLKNAKTEAPCYSR